jgi:hypothetical protein
MHNLVPQEVHHLKIARSKTVHQLAAVGIATAAPVFEPATDPIEAAESATAVNEAVTAKPTEPAQDEMIESVAGATAETLVAGASAFDENLKRPTPHHSRPQRDAAIEFLLKLLHKGLIREDMKPGERLRVFKRHWPKNIPRPERDSVRRAWQELLETDRVPSKSKVSPPPPKK